MPILVKLSDGSKIRVKNCDSLEELKEKLLEKKMMEETAKAEKELDERAGIHTAHIRQVFREETKRGGGPGGTDPTGKRKDAKILNKRTRKERYQDNGSWDENL